MASAVGLQVQGLYGTSHRQHHRTLQHQPSRTQRPQTLQHRTSPPASRACLHQITKPALGPVSWRRAACSLAGGGRRDASSSLAGGRQTRLVLIGSSAMPCCPEGSEPLVPARSDYISQGSTQTWTRKDGRSSVKVYVVTPPSSQKSNAAIILAHDIGGPMNGRHVEVCDQFAAAGYTVVMPDLFKGSMPAGMPPWYKVPLLLPAAVKNLRRRWKGEVEEDISTVLEHLTTDLGIEKVGTIGFCYGAWVVFKTCSNEMVTRQQTIRCGVSMHPSVHSVAPFQGEDQWDVVEAVDRPQLVLSTGGEPKEWKPGREVISQEGLHGKLKCWNISGSVAWLLYQRGRFQCRCTARYGPRVPAIT